MRTSIISDVYKRQLLPFIPDYRINLLAPREITDFTGFRTSIRQLFEVLQNAYGLSPGSEDRDALASDLSASIAQGSADKMCIRDRWSTL